MKGRLFREAALRLSRSKMPRITAYQFPAVYESLGIDMNNLGYIMLNVEPFSVDDYIDRDDLYSSATKEFVDGMVIDTKAHVTLLAGLLGSGPAMKFQVDEVLADWNQPAKVKIDHLGSFEGTDDNGDKYSAIVAHLDLEGLEEANQRLRLLPHIDPFPEGYKAHLTIAYVKPEATTEWVESLSHLVGKLVPTTDLNYGK
jgi:2'-5' RNA ligase